MLHDIGKIGVAESGVKKLKEDDIITVQEPVHVPTKQEFVSSTPEDGQSRLSFVENAGLEFR